MRRTRYMTWVFLVLSLAFFTIRDFRFALEAPLASLWTERMFGWSPQDPFRGPRYSRWLARLYTLDRYVSPAKLIALADEAARRGDSEFVAFAALNLGPKKEALRLADRAVEANPDLTWIYFYIVLTGMSPSDWQGPSEISREQLAARIERLEMFDPDNAVPHILNAQFIQKGPGKEWPQGYLDAPGHLDALARETAWCQQMDKAFRARRYASYGIRYFTLMRHVLRARRWDHPVVVATIEESARIPNLLATREYTNVLVLKYGAEAEVAGKLSEALDDYFVAAQFGERLRGEGNSFIEQLVGIAVQHITYPKLAAALRKAGREKEAGLAEDVERVNWQHSGEFRNPLGNTSYRLWLVLLANFAAGLVAVFVLATLLSVAYVNAKLWIRSEKKGRLYQTLTIAENYAPLLLFLSCLALYLSSVPFRRQFENYMTVQEILSGPEHHASIYPAWGLEGEPHSSLDVPNAFQDYVPVALAGVILLTVALALGLWRARRKEVLPEPAAFERRLKTQNYAVLLLVALCAAVFVAIERGDWASALTGGAVLGLVVGGALWTSASVARRAHNKERSSWAAKATEAGAYLLILLLAGVSGSVAAGRGSELILSRQPRLQDWTILAVLCLPVLVAGAVSASRMRFRRVGLLVFGLLVVGVAAWAGIGEWRSSKKKSPVAQTSAPTRPSPVVPPPLTEPEVLVPIAEGKATEPLAQAARVRGVAFHEGIFGLWVLREAGAGDDVVKTFRSARWDEDLMSLDKQIYHVAVAENALRADTQRDPKNPVLHFALGLVLGWVQEWDAAITECQTAAHLKPDIAGAHRALGESLLENRRDGHSLRAEMIRMKEGVPAREKQQFATAIAELRKAVRLDPNDALAHHDLAGALPEPQDRDEIIREYKAELYLEPDDSDARLSLAMSLKENGEFAEAAGEFRELLWSHPWQLHDPSIRLEFADALRKSGNLDEAITQYRELVRLHPSSATAHEGLGEVLAENDELTAALAEFQQAVRLSPGSTSAHNDLGLALQRSGNLDGAIAEFQEAIHVGSNSAELHTNLARALEKKGDLKGALEQYRFAARLEPKDTEARADYERLSRQFGQRH